MYMYIYIYIYICMLKISKGPTPPGVHKTESAQRHLPPLILHRARAAPRSGRRCAARAARDGARDPGAGKRDGGPPAAAGSDSQTARIFACAGDGGSDASWEKS